MRLGSDLAYDVAARLILEQGQKETVQENAQVLRVGDQLFTSAQYARKQFLYQFLTFYHKLLWNHSYFMLNFMKLWGNRQRILAELLQLLQF